MNEALVSLFNQIKGSQSFANRLIANKMDLTQMRTNDVLLYDEWKAFDKAVITAYQQRLTGVADLQARGLTYNIPNGMAKTVLGYQDASDASDAEMSMSGKTRGRRDRLEFDMNYLPLPLTHKDFSIDLRQLEASRSGGMPIDTTMATVCGQKIAEKVETTLFKGSSTYTFGGGTIYGYEDEPNITIGSLNAAWDDSATSGDNILDDIIRMKQAMIADRCYGPYIVYIPTVYETAIDGDFKAASDKSIRQRILEIANIAAVKVSDKMSSTKVIMVQMTVDTIRLVNALGITVVQWDVDGGMEVNFKVMAIQVPQTRHDQAGHCGIVVYSE